MNTTECTSNENSINDSMQLNDSHVRTSTPVPNTESSNLNHCTNESQSSIPSSPSDIKDIKSPLSNSMETSGDAIDSSCMDEVSSKTYFLYHHELGKMLTVISFVHCPFRIKKMHSKVAKRNHTNRKKKNEVQLKS